MHFLINSVISTTLSISVIDSLLIGVIAFSLMFPFIRKRTAKVKLWLLSAIVYGCFLFFLTIPIVLEPFPDSFVNKISFVLPDILWNPIASIGGVCSLSDFVYLIIGNFCLLMPFPLLILVKAPECTFKRFAATPVFISLGIEAAQFFGNVMIGYSSRTVEVLDILLNASGAWLCFYITKSIMQKGGHWAKSEP